MIELNQRKGGGGKRCLVCVLRELIPRRQLPVLLPFEVTFEDRICPECEKRRHAHE